MPIVDASDPQVWVDQYRSFLNHPTDKFAPRITVGYTRAGFLPQRLRRGHRLVDVLGLQDGQNILIIGAGFCWMAEGIQERLPAATIIGVDTSSWVQGNKDLDETAELRAAVTAGGLDPDAGLGADYVGQYKGGARAKKVVMAEDSLSNASRNRIKRNGFGATSAVIDWAISEDILPWLTDAEVTQAAPHFRDLATNIAHMVTPFIAAKAGPLEQPPAWNWKTKVEWEAVLAPDVIVTTQETG